MVNWLQDNSGDAEIVLGPVMQDVIGGVYDIGSHSIDYVVADGSGLRSKCSFKILVQGKATI